MAHNPLSVQKPRPFLVYWQDIRSFLVHFNFSRREKELCSNLFLFCPHKMCFQDKSRIQHGLLPISVGWGLLARLLLSFILVETHTVICSRQALSLSGHAEEASVVEYPWGGQASNVQTQKGGGCTQIPCVCVCVRERERERQKEKV
ncbi:hypothetical protein AMECASPLE_036433 [Ameca splendens]|uniref:Uncharacterized protein n=1 Tax=Ameca splendens TaxID=208324 RepID=A0ABV1AE14_9TELE